MPKAKARTEARFDSTKRFRSDVRHLVEVMLFLLGWHGQVEAVSLLVILMCP
jgi:hypothetical protein